MPYHEITKFQLLAGLIREDRAYRELEGGEAFGDVLIEILRRLHHWNDDKWDATTVIDAIFEAIAEEFRYAIGYWDKTGSDTSDDESTPSEGSVLDAVQAAVDKMRPAAELAAEASMPPELDFPDQH